VGSDEASFSVPWKDTEVTFARAWRKGDRLELEEAPTTWMHDPEIGDPYLFSMSTFSLELAMRGWPLVRSAKHWEKDRYELGGFPEALAYMITFWEARERARGWIVDTPRIAGLEYPTWKEWEEEEDDEGAKEEGKQC